MIRKAIVPVLVLLLLAAGSVRGQAQEAAIRFEIAGVADSTFSFAIGRHDWVARGQRGFVVDPRRRDVLIARFRILRVEGGLATALVTGQSTSISTQHAALLERPAAPWYRQRLFWTGLIVGGVIGAVAGSF